MPTGSAKRKYVVEVGLPAVAYTTVIVQADSETEARKLALAAANSDEDKDDWGHVVLTGRNWPAAFYGQRGGIGKQW